MKKDFLTLVFRAIIIALIFVFLLGVSFFAANLIMKQNWQQKNAPIMENEPEISQAEFTDGKQMESEQFSLSLDEQTIPDIMLLPLKNLSDFASSSATIAKIRTNKGTFTLKLFTQEAPLTVANFISLAEDGFYNGQKFHRAEPGFVVQIGDPASKTASSAADLAELGAGHPDYRISDEFTSALSHDKIGMVSMANLNVNGLYPDTGGSQFFMTLGPATYLDGRHTIFAQVVDNVEALKDIEVGDEIISIKFEEE
ncbi:MAG: peptidylprolyl isomerase [bacterium]|nr:peptidylprolyl isomerase [bacterium]